MGHLSQRVARVEARLRAVDAEETAELEQLAALLTRHEEAEERRARRWEQLRATMAPEHVALAMEARERRGADPPHPARHLGLIVESMLTWAEAGFFEGRLALPPVVGEVYLEHTVWPAAQCLSCQLPLPYRPQPTPTMPPERWFFTRCPDCGGEVSSRFGRPPGAWASAAGARSGPLKLRDAGR